MIWTYKKVSIYLQLYSQKLPNTFAIVEICIVFSLKPIHILSYGQVKHSGSKKADHLKWQIKQKNGVFRKSLRVREN